MSKLRAADLRLIDDIFEMGSGYVLDFNNQTFAEFFEDELGVNIDDSRWDAQGTSKAKRLRFFLRSSPGPLVLKTLQALWDYREANRRRRGLEETVPNAADLFYEIIERIGGKRPRSAEPKPTESFRGVDPAHRAELKDQLLALSALEPQPRGFAFEKFLKAFFDANGLSGRASFRLVGEQIDGSFVAAGATYLLEAKWTALQVGAADLRSFNAKVEDKAKWTRGLFVSDSGFSREGLVAFGKGHSVVCMDGLDLYELFNRNLSFSEVLATKVRRAAETGKVFVPIREL